MLLTLRVRHRPSVCLPEMKWGLALRVSVAAFLLVAPAFVQAETLTVLFKSNPEGASVYANGRLLGQTPFELNYKVTTVNNTGEVQLAPLTFQWRSGRTQTVSPVLDVSTNGYSEWYLVTEANPPQTDLNYLQYKEAEAAYQQARANYQQALSEYDKARAQLDSDLSELRQLHDSVRLNEEFAPNSKFTKLLALAGHTDASITLSQDRSAVDDARSNLDNAQAALDAAQSRLTALQQ